MMHSSTDSEVLVSAYSFGDYDLSAFVSVNHVITLQK